MSKSYASELREEWSEPVDESYERGCALAIMCSLTSRYIAPPITANHGRPWCE